MWECECECACTSLHRHECGRVPGHMCNRNGKDEWTLCTENDEDEWALRIGMTRMGGHCTFGMSRMGGHSTSGMTRMRRHSGIHVPLPGEGEFAIPIIFIGIQRVERVADACTRMRRIGYDNHGLTLRTGNDEDEAHRASGMTWMRWRWTLRIGNEKYVEVDIAQWE
jgi:hypothetical protein